MQEFIYLILDRTMSYPISLPMKFPNRQKHSTTYTANQLEKCSNKVTVNFTNCSVTSMTTWNNSARDFILAKPVKDQERIFQPISYQCFLVSLVSNLLYQLIRTLESTETKGNIGKK